MSHFPLTDNVIVYGRELHFCGIEAVIVVSALTYKINKMI